ncbi:hypothetical protein L243_36440, partial [Salmonella enterica subsp. enterica serovar Worthington str. BCH-3008]
ASSHWPCNSKPLHCSRNAGIIAGSRVSEAKIPALREQCNGLLLQGQWLDASIQLTSTLGGGYHS